MKIEDLLGEHGIMLAAHAGQIGSAALRAELRITEYGWSVWFCVYRDGVLQDESHQLSTAVRKFNEVTE